jgi:two-component system, NtrC family, sensor kinase
LLHNTPLKYKEYNEKQPLLNPQKVPSLGQLVRTKRPVQVVDMAVAEPDSPIHRLGGARTLLVVPMLKDDVLVGGMGIYRQEVRPFTDKQIELVKNFAAQAVIAIENARLLNELRQRTDDLSQRTTDLTESLEQQTATSKVLDVISRSAFDLQAVFETVAENSVRLCGPDRGIIYRFDGELLRLTAGFNVSEELKQWVEHHPIRPVRHSASARAAVERRTIHIPDILADPEYTFEVKDVEKFRTILAVPILKGSDLLGVRQFTNPKLNPSRRNRSRSSKHLPTKQPLRLIMFGC